MIMSTIPEPKVVRLFKDLFWAHTTDDWIMKTTYHRGILYVSVTINVGLGSTIKIRRSFKVSNMQKRESKNDLWGLAKDCVDEIRSEAKKQRSKDSE